ncbi:hypothetical protein Dimus_003283 [Dionaea muscipula]
MDITNFNTQKTCSNFPIKSPNKNQGINLKKSVESSLWMKNTKARVKRIFHAPELVSMTLLLTPFLWKRWPPMEEIEEKKCEEWRKNWRRVMEEGNEGSGVWGSLGLGLKI